MIKDYDVAGFYDEMFAADGKVRPGQVALSKYLQELGTEKLRQLQDAAAKMLLNLGITFNVYADSEATERVFPFDIIPRIISNTEWSQIEAGLKQRIKALNYFINDVYREQKIFKDNVIPKELVLSSQGYLEPCAGLKPNRQIWCHITGTDLIRGGDGKVYVLEDNLRTPSGISYVLENREMMKRIFSDLFTQMQVRVVADYPQMLLNVLKYVSPMYKGQVGVYTPGIYNSAYYEHSYLAQKMGAHLVEGQDLVVKNHHVYMRTVGGLRPIHVLYRRIDDDFIDPTVFRKDSMLGVPGLFEAYRRGNITLANAPGSGVADDKAIYAYVPDIIKYYLDEDMILPNVPTYLCSRPSELDHVLKNIDKLVVKAVSASGGYGMLIGPHSTRQQQNEFKEKIKAEPRNYIGQETIQLSRVPTMCEDGIEGRHVDLRPFILYGDDIRVIPGGLTRVALRKGSLVVNSSQGGGSKDTWVVNA